MVEHGPSSRGGGVRTLVSDWHEGTYPAWSRYSDGRAQEELLVESHVDDVLSTFRILDYATDMEGKKSDPYRHDFDAMFVGEFVDSAEVAHAAHWRAVFAEDKPPLIHFCASDVMPAECPGGRHYDAPTLHLTRWRYQQTPFGGYEQREGAASRSRKPRSPAGSPPRKEPRAAAGDGVQGRGGGVSAHVQPEADRAGALRGKLEDLRARIRAQDGEEGRSHRRGSGRGAAQGASDGPVVAIRSASGSPAPRVAGRPERGARDSRSPEERRRGDRSKSKGKSGSLQERLLAKAGSAQGAGRSTSRSPRDRDRRSRHRSRRRSRDRSRGSASSSRDERHFGRARLSTREKARRAIERRPGEITDRAMEKMKSYLGDQGVSTAADGTTPIMSTYFTGVYLPSVKKTISSRNEVEMRNLAAAVDHIQKAEFDKASDLLVQQYKAIEQLQADGNWRAARHLSVMPDSRVSLLEDREKEDLYRDERAELGLAKLQSEIHATSSSVAVR